MPFTIPEIIRRLSAGAAVTLLLCLSAFDARAAKSDYEITPEISQLIATVDSLLAHNDDIRAAKEARIDNKRQALARASGTEHRYWLTVDLYEEYSTYDSDSALAYADRALTLARALGRRDLIDDMQLNRAYVLSATGILDEASECLNDIDIDNLRASALWRYYGSLLFIDSRRTQYLGAVGDEGPAYTAQLDSLLQETVKKIPADDPNYIWFVGWANFKGPEEAQKVIPEIKKSVDSRAFDSRRDAMDAWVLSKLYEYAGDYGEKLRYLLLSSIADLRSANKEIASLEEVAAILYDLGDLEHSNTYVSYSIACANDYKSRVRVGHLAELQQQALTAIHERSFNQERQIHVYLVALILILIALASALVLMVRKARQLKRSQADVESINRELKERIAEIQATREQLSEANGKLSALYAGARESASDLARTNEDKENLIASIFGLCSSYIDKLDGFRKNIFRMIMARRFDDILAMTKNPDLSHAEIKELYANFDKVFLGIYPDFVADFNTLLRPEEQITLKRPDQLTTELRIYALVRLGLNDSVKIAKFLHCSVQTVYNTRQRTRNKANIPREDFAETVKSLGRPAF